MALISCPECKREISSTAPTCPQCGYRMVSHHNETPLRVTTVGWRSLEAVGFTIILLSMGGCGVGAILYNMSVSAIGWGSVGCFIGLVVFIVGRFAK